MRFSIVYFSAAGHTLKVIRHIAEQMGGIDRAVDLSDPFLKETSFTKDDLQCQYCISYLVSADADEDNSSYESFIESVCFQ